MMLYIAGLEEGPCADFSGVVDCLSSIDSESPYLALAQAWQCLQAERYKESQQFITTGSYLGSITSASIKPPNNDTMY